MATLKLTIDRRYAYKDGRYPILIRLTSNSQSTFINTAVRLQEKEWDNKKNKVNKVHPEYKSLNLHLKDKLFELEKKLLVLNSQGLNTRELKEVLLNDNKPQNISFLEFATKEIQLLKDQERFGNAKCYATSVKRLLKFTGEKIMLDKITYSLIVEFDAQLIKEGVGKNTVAIYMREIRAIMNKAINKGLLDRNKYPFYGFKIRTEKTVNRAIIISDMQKIKQESLSEGSPMWQSRNIFFLIFNLIGISFIDLAFLTNDNIQNGRIVYRRRKTGKMYSIKITSEAQRFFDLYKSADSKFLMPIFQLDKVQKKDEIKTIQQRLQVCNKHLKKLGVLCNMPLVLTSYVARYSWANIAKSLGYSKDLIAESLGHEYGNRVTGIYLDNYGNEIIDAVNESVINSIN